MEASVNWFVDIYESIHGPLVVCLCIFGISSNLINIAVLSRRHLITPTNILLTGLSSAQLLLLMNYLIYTFYVILDTDCNRATKTYGWLSYLLLNVNLNLIFHTIGLVHTTMLAVFRYAAVAFPTRCRGLVSIRGAKSVVLIAFTGVPIVCATFYPNSIISQRNATTTPEDPNSTADCPEWTANDERYGPYIYGLRYSDKEFLRDYNFWFFGTVCKLLPCLLLVVLSALLLRELSQVRRRRERLRNQQQQTTKTKKKTKKSTKSSMAERQHRQITVMLVGVVLLFVAVELPQGIMNMLSAILKEEFIHIYINMGDFFEMTTVLYSSVNFILYCSMSSQFRTTFKLLFVGPCCRFVGNTKWSATTAVGASSSPTMLAPAGAGCGEDARRFSRTTVMVSETAVHTHNDYAMTTALIDTAL